ncbi:MAG: extracellular solute-binding protein [Anaerolineaceae bacterium]|nr:extracellular solute-binding protein [Anaerolineaceae bacterium]
MKKRKLTQPILTKALSLIILVAILLAACTSNGTLTPTNDPSAEAADATQAAAETPAPRPTATPSRPIHLEVDGADLAGIVVRVVHPWVGEMAELLDSLAMQFSLSNEWDIWVEMESAGSESAVVDTLQADITQNDLPGIVIVPPAQLEPLDGQFYTVNLLNYYNDAEWGLSVAEQADIPDVFLSAYRSDEMLSALPVAPQATLFFFNQTWAQELGYAGLPSTSTDLQKMFCDAAYQNNIDDVDRTDGTGGWLVNLDPNVLLSWYTAFGGVLDSDSLEFNNEAGQEAFGFLETLRTKGCAWESVNVDPYAYFAERLTILFAGNTGQIPYLKNWMASSGSEDLWTVAPFVGTGDSSVVVDGPAMLMTANSAEIQMASWLFMKYLLTPEVQAKIAQTAYSIPVRESSLELMQNFAVQNPQWLLAYQFTSDAVAAPASETWGIKQWLLQDAVFQLLQLDVNDSIKAEDVLGQVDAMMDELEGTTP